MSQTYALEGITCSGCLDIVQEAIQKQQDVELIDITLDPPQVTLNGVTEEYIGELNDILIHKGNYRLIAPTSETAHKPTSYRPLLMILGFLVGAVLLAQWQLGRFDLFVAMRHFMGGFFLVFSFFKLLDLKGFVKAYSQYDIVAARFPGYGFIYPFLELTLGAYFLSPLHHPAALWTALILMLVSSIGVIKNLVSGRKISCACLGTAFNLPMSTVTLVEDLLMVLMSAAMLWYL